MAFRAGLSSSTAVIKVAGAAAVAGALSLPMGFVLPMNYALAQCFVGTAGADNFACAGALDGTLSDALAGNDTITVNTDIGVSAGATVSGGADDDIIALTVGDDLGVNAAGAGQVLGDAGADTITLISVGVGNSGTGTVDGGVGTDSISLSGSILGFNFNAAGRVQGDAGADTITLDNSYVGNIGNGTVSGGDGADSIALTNGSRVSNNAASTSQILGDAGDDTITLDASYLGFSGLSTVSGGGGADSIRLSGATIVGRNASGKGQILGDAGADTIELDRSYIGILGTGTVSGGADNDSIVVTNKSDVGRGAGSMAQVLGDAGADTIIIIDSRVGYSGAGTVSGGAGNDSIALSVNSRIGRSVNGTGQILGDAGADTITLSATFVGRAGAGTVDGGAGNDSIALRRLCRMPAG